MSNRIMLCIPLACSLLFILPSVGKALVPDYCYKVTLDKDVVSGCTRFLREAKSSKDRSIALTRRGRGLYFLGDYDGALRDYNEAFDITPDRQSRSMLLLYRGDAWHRKGEHDRAIAEYNELLQLDPRYESGYQNRGRTWREKGELDRALADYNKALQIDPKLAGVYNNRGLIWIDKGEYDKAIKDFGSSIRLSPKNSVAYASRGQAWRLKGDLNQALNDQTKAIEVGGPASLYEYVLRGDTYRYKGDFAKAAADYEKALQVRKGYSPALTGLGITFERMGDQRKAREYFRLSIEGNAEDRGYDISRSAILTAQARLAALDSGELPPVIPPAPAKITLETSLPTPAISAQVLNSPLKQERLQSNSAQGRRVALVIGNSAYQKAGALKNPTNDAAALNASLRNMGFDVVNLALNSSREALITAVRRFATEADSAEWAVVYYSGHGIEVNGRNYLIPVDATLKTDRDVEFETVAVDQIMSAIDGARKLKLVILDACRNNPFAASIQKTGRKEPSEIESTSGGEIGVRAIGKGLGEVKIKGASLVVFAAKHGQTALDGEGDNSPFTIALVQRIATPGVEINKIFRLVRDDVMEATGGRQEPYTYGSLPGREDYFFVAAK